MDYVRDMIAGMRTRESTRNLKKDLADSMNKNKTRIEALANSRKEIEGDIRGCIRFESMN